MATPPMALPKQHARVLDLQMAYHEVGAGRPIVLLHGNPTSSYLWRGVLPHLRGLGRCIVPDLIGMGDSEKLASSGPGSYRFVDHRRYLDALLDHLGVTEDVVLVGHDWGGGLLLDWANRHREAIAGLAYTETILAPIDSWDDWPEVSRPIFQAMRSEKGEEIVLTKNVFVERILPASVMDALDPEVMEEYRRPFRDEGEGRRPTLTWPRELPIDGEPADVTEIAASYQAWLGETTLPKLFIKADPGFLTPLMERACRGWSNQQTATVRGIHFVQEDSPAELGEALAGWLATL